MLGKHVKVAVHNKKFIHKILCAFLAVLLLGLMVPHGIIKSVNAYAENNADNGEPNEIAMTVIAEGDTMFDKNMVIAALNDPRSGAWWRAGELDSFADPVPGKDGMYRRFTQYPYDDDKYGEVIYRLNGNARIPDYPFVVSHDPDNIQFSGFNYRDDVNWDDVVSEPQTIDSVFSVKISVNNPSAYSAQLYLGGDLVDFGTFVNMRYNKEYSLADKKLTVDSTASGVPSVFTVETSEAVFNGFALTQGEGTKIVPGMQFSAQIAAPAVTLQTQWATDTPEEITLYKWDSTSETYEQVDMPIFTTFEYGKTFHLSDTHLEDYVGGLTIDDSEYAFKIAAPQKYKWLTEGGWTYGNYDTPVTSEPTVLDDNVSFTAHFEMEVGFEITFEEAGNSIQLNGEPFTTPQYYEYNTPISTDVNENGETVLCIGDPEGVHDEYTAVPGGDCVFAGWYDGEQSAEGTVDKAKVITAKFLNNSSAQTGDSLDFGWLIIIAILGAAGVGFALYRRYKCSKSRK